MRTATSSRDGGSLISIEPGEGGLDGYLLHCALDRKKGEPLFPKS